MKKVTLLTEMLKALMTPPSKRTWNILTVHQHLFYRVLDKHAPQKHTVIKNYKLELKPWMTTRI